MGLPQRIEAKIERTESCWVWTAATRRGYGVLHYQGRAVPAHRVVYELLVGPIGDGLQIDHLCRNRWCVNPEHLEPVSQRENLLRGETIPAKHARRTHCDNGHPFDAENTTYSQDGYRRCKACHRAAERRRYVRSGGAA